MPDGGKMSEQYSFSTIDSLLIQLAIKNRELSQKKNELTQQIKVRRADIAARKTEIKSSNENIKKLEEEISVRENTVKHNKANAKSMRITNSLLLQYKQTLSADLDSRKNSYSNDVQVYEERIASYKKKFESYKEHYLQNPLAQKLVRLQTEKEEIESRIKACDDQTSMKQKELDCLTGAKQDFVSSENSPDSCVEQVDLAQQEKQSGCHQEENCDASIGFSSLHLHQTQDAEKTPEETNTEMHEQNDQGSINTPHSTSEEVWSRQQFDDQPTEMPKDEPAKETSPVDVNLEQPSPVSTVQDRMEEEEVQETEAADKTPVRGQETNDRPAVMASIPYPEMESQSFSAAMTPVPSTPIFTFNFSPTSSPQRSGTKSPCFLFSMNSNPSTPGFTGFEVETGSSQEEGSVFALTGSLFNEKKTNDTKSPSCSEFLFGQPEQNDDFQFAFSANGPQSANKEENAQDFPFSFNF